MLPNGQRTPVEATSFPSRSFLNCRVTKYAAVLWTIAGNPVIWRFLMQLQNDQEGMQ